MINEQDGSRFYAYLRFEEASVALRVALRMNVVEILGDKELTQQEFQEQFELTSQGANIFVLLLRLLDVLEYAPDSPLLRTTQVARSTIDGKAPLGRKAYLSMGDPTAADQLIALLRGESDQETPLYSAGSEASLMEDESTHHVAREVAYGLASRAKCFAEPLANFVHKHCHENCQTIADLGAGSPHFASACIDLLPAVNEVHLVDQAAGLEFAREMWHAQNRSNAEEESKLQFTESNIFLTVPSADLYCLSNTAHDWLPSQYHTLIQNIVANSKTHSKTHSTQIVIHEPLMIDRWSSTEAWQHALWMACYALALFRLTNGQGTCYSLAEHDAILARSEFRRVQGPCYTADGCSALLYERL